MMSVLRPFLHTRYTCGSPHDGHEPLAIACMAFLHNLDHLLDGHMAVARLEVNQARLVNVVNTVDVHSLAVLF